jgi:hypothetical protein
MSCIGGKHSQFSQMNLVNERLVCKDNLSVGLMLFDVFSAVLLIKDYPVHLIQLKGRR